MEDQLTIIEDGKISSTVYASQSSTYKPTVYYKIIKTEENRYVATCNIDHIIAIGTDEKNAHYKLILTLESYFNQDADSFNLRSDLST